MKSNYLFSVDLTSAKKFRREQLAEVKASLELNEDFLELCVLFSKNLDINFSGYLELYIEDQPFDSDILPEVEGLIEIIDTLIAGGWGSDSKIEWVNEIPDETYVWFKEGDKWSSVIKDHERGFIGEDEDWNDNSDSYSPGYGSDFDDDY
jgi:hypothetical protein